jgi:multidrug efflux system outer membrane protein
VLADPRLVALIEQGLAHNQDIAQAVANVQAAQAQFRIARAALFPELDASAGWTHSGGDRALGISSSAKGDPSMRRAWCRPTNSTCSGGCAI